VPSAQKLNVIGRFPVIFQKPTVAFEARIMRAKSTTIQVEFEIKRSSTTSLSAVASASVAFRWIRTDGDGEMR
jgi:hypothetical protein